MVLNAMADRNNPSALRRQPSFNQRLRPHVERALTSIVRNPSTRTIRHSLQTSSSHTSFEAGLKPSSQKQTLRKMPRQHSLSINLGRLNADSGDRSSRSPRSPRTSPKPHTTHDHGGNTYAEGYDIHPHSPITSLPTPPSPRSPKQRTKSIFSSKIANKSTAKITKVDRNAKPPPGEAAASTGQTSQVYQYRKSPGSTPELSLQHDNGIPRSDPIPISNEAPEARSGSQSIKSSSVPQTSSLVAAPNEKEKRRDDKKHKFLGLGRRSSVKEKGKDSPYGDKLRGDYRTKEAQKQSSKYRDEPPLKTAPLGQERGFRDMMTSTLRNHSADRCQDNQDSSDENSTGAVPPLKPRGSTRAHVREAAEAGSGFLTTFGNRAADGFGRAGKALAKLGRSGSGHQDTVPSIPKKPYELKVINMPLVQQTRITRISKDLTKCRDKTEFWMPALPWRCIDYLNSKGIEQEGIYRVPGSAQEVKHWEMRFDTEYDIDLLKPDTPIYDVNTVASILKNWLRTLKDMNDEIVPTKVQTEVISALTKDGASAPQQAPQELRDALSKLPPFNYYLLFALTCHISLLNAHSQVTKMNYNNLRICLQPCMGLSGNFFQWLVEDWRNCWQGCWTEREFLEKEEEWHAEQQRSQNQDATSERAESRQQDRSGARSVTPAGNRRDERDTEKERPRTSHKDSKINLANERRTQQFDKFQIASQQKQRPSTSHAAMNSSSLDASQAPPMPAMPKDRDKDDANRAISSSGSSKPSVMSYDGRSTPDQTTNSRDVQSPQRQHESSTATRRGKNNNGGGGSSSRGRERQGRDKDGNPLSLRLNDREYKENSTSPTSTHILSAMKGNGPNNTKKNSDLNDRNNAANSDESKVSDQAMTDDGSETATVDKRCLKAPQLSPMKPLTPMGVEIDLEMKSRDNS